MRHAVFVIPKTNMGTVECQAGRSPRGVKGLHHGFTRVASAYQRRKKSFRRWYALGKSRQRVCNAGAWDSPHPGAAHSPDSPHPGAARLPLGIGTYPWPLPQGKGKNISSLAPQNWGGGATPVSPRPLTHGCARRGGRGGRGVRAIFPSGGNAQGKESMSVGGDQEERDVVVGHWGGEQQAVNAV